MKNNIHEIYSDIVKRTTNHGFLKTHNLTEKRMISVLNGDFKLSLAQSLNAKDYSMLSLFNAYRSLALDLFTLTLDDDFLKELYQYLLSKSFIEAVTKEPSLKSVVYDLFLIIENVVSDYQKTSDDESFMSVYPLQFLSESEIASLDDHEYQAFKSGFEDQYIYELLKLHYEVYGRSTIEHILGVHHLAMYIARQLINKGIPVDLGRVSGAAAGHDIGKYGCRPEELKKIAYYHYYYTYQWFSDLGINYIKNVAVYHSTWDLELESLSIESLILIFSDFCVKRSKAKPGKFMMKFLTVDEAFKVILDKLDNVDIQKKKRYERVYKKLSNFRDYMHRLGICVEIDNYGGKASCKLENKVENREITLESGMVLINELKDIAIEKSILLMHKLKNIESLNEIIQNALSEKDIQMLRRYLFVFEEYSTYLTPSQKLITMDFLKDYLIHSEEDIRKECSQLIGKLLAFYDENYTKELPLRAKVEYTVETKLNKLRSLLTQFLLDDIRLTQVKRNRQIHSYLQLLHSLFSYVDDTFKETISILLLDYLDEEMDSFGYQFMVEVLPLILNYLDDENKNKAVSFLMSSLNSSWSIIALQQIEVLYPKYEMINIAIGSHKADIYKSLMGNQILISPLYNLLSLEPVGIDLQEIYLSNLKSAISKTTKEMQIEYLYACCENFSQDQIFYTAMHYCNILKVSAYESVRQKAGGYLVKIYDNLNSHEQNDIVIELLRALEIEGYGFTRYIPNFIGQLIPKMGQKEYKEIMDDVNHKISNAGVHVRVLLLSTLSHTIQSHLKMDEFEKINLLIGMLFKGFFTEEKLSEQITFNILCKDLIGNEDFSLALRFELFKIIYKKLSVYIAEIDEFNGLNLLNYSVGLKYIYRFITDFEFFHTMTFKKREKIAFYPGTFDPFSLGQKLAAKDANSLGFDVFIGLSEFHWRRRTQPSRVRRRIVEMSIADQLNIFTFPQSIPINLKKENDLERLESLFENQEIYIVIGEDTLLNNSLYKDLESGIYGFSHIIYKRKGVVQEGDLLSKRIGSMKKEVIIRTLEQKYELIDVNQIRRNIDNNWDAYDVMDDLATKYIKKHNLYKNEPQFKSVVSTNHLSVKIDKLSESKDYQTIVDTFDVDSTHLNHLSKGTYGGDLDKDLILERYLLTIVHETNQEIIAYSVFAKASPKHLFNEIRSLEILDEIALKSYEDILIIDYIDLKARDEIHALDQIILTETLTSQIKEGSTYAVVKCHDELDDVLSDVLIRSGFIKRRCTYSQKAIYSVDMSCPLVLNLDGTTRMKADFRQDYTIRETIKKMRGNLQEALINLYPGMLLLSFDRSMVYNHMIRLISQCNSVPINEQENHGDFMCVPYGDVFKRWLLPNTVTKSLHTERFYSLALDQYEVDAYPEYLSLEDQSNAIKAYDMPIILVDDLLDKGKRMKALEPYFEKENIQQIVSGILTHRGKKLYESKGFSMASAYYIPKIKVWFNEADLYAYIGGDSLKRPGREIKDILYSTNLMLPFSYPKYIKDVKKAALFNLSMVCLENAQTIMYEIEKKYLELYKRNLTISGLREVMIAPRVPDVGNFIKYDPKQRPSLFLDNELERLKRMENAFKDT